MTDQNADPAQYGRHERPEPGTPCVVCDAVPPVPMLDHCHSHGWVRGPVCASCNCLMGSVDAGKSPRVKRGRALLEALIDHAARCPECPPVTVELLDPPPPPPKGILVTRETADRAKDVWIDVVAATKTLPTRKALNDALIRVGLAHLDEIAELLTNQQNGSTES